MTQFVCSTCGTSFPPFLHPPAFCPICTDERQYVPRSGQRWTTAEAIDRDHRASIAYDGAFIGIGMTPEFAIGQRALLLRTKAGNVLWDCVPFVDDALVEIIEGLGGLAAIALSHPHFYGRMESWSDAFGGVPVFCHAADRAFAQNPGPSTRYWAGEREEILPGLTLIRCAGHFDGSAVLHVKSGAAGNEHGALLSGDTLQVTPGGTHVAFMRSYPNMIPLAATAVRGIVAALDGFEFDTIAGGFWGRTIAGNGRQAMEESADRYLAALEGEESFDS